MTTRKTELFPAFVWDCTNCGRENFERAVMPPFQTVADEQYARELLGVDGDDGFPVIAPKHVLCRVCHVPHATDATKLYGDEDDQED